MSTDTLTYNLQKRRARFSKLFEYASQTQGNVTSLGAGAIGVWPIIMTVLGLTTLIIASIALASQKSAQSDRNQQTNYFAAIIGATVVSALGFVYVMKFTSDLISLVRDLSELDTSPFEFRNAAEEAARQLTYSKEQLNLSIRQLEKMRGSGTISQGQFVDAARKLRAIDSQVFDATADDLTSQRIRSEDMASETASSQKKLDSLTRENAALGQARLMAERERDIALAASGARRSF